MNWARSLRNNRASPWSGDQEKKKMASNFHLTVSGYFTLPPFRCALEVMGANRILSVVNYPYSKNAAGRQFLDALPLGRGDKKKIAHGNAERLLRL